MLRLDKISFRYPSGFQLQGVDWRVQSGALLALIGPNGCGKSTIVRLISKLLMPDSGRIYLDGRPLEGYSPRRLARLMAVIPSENYFEFPFPVREVVAMGRFPYLGRLEWMRAEDHRTVENALRLTQVREFAERPISQLSSGERQRVLLARAIAQQPRLLVLDEPNAHLDVHHQIAAFRLLRRLNRESRMTIIAVLHDLSMAAAFFETVTVLKAGRLVQEGPPREVITESMIRRVYGAEVNVSSFGDGPPVITYSTEERGLDEPDKDVCRDLST